ncbi:MAG TPA: hypothetical protein VHC20_03685 [Candidatus Paceibacterota bacterium]|nr:hypothetical protein [Candidatus Paceibacterota bacterium]
MDPELKSLLDENLRLARENNMMLLAMKRRAQWGLIGQAVFWVLFVIAPLIFLWGYLGPLMSAVNGNFDGSGANMSDLQNLLQQYQNQ